MPITTRTAQDPCFDAAPGSGEGLSGAGGRPGGKRPRGRFASRLIPFLRGEYAIAPRAARLVLVIYALLLLSRLIDSAFLSREGEYLSTVLLQLLIFPIPAYLYIRLRGKDFTKSLRLRRFPLTHLFLILSAILMLMAGCTLLAMVCGMMQAQPSFTLYDTFSSVHDGSAGTAVRLVLTYGLLPAFCEELVFRGILCAEYEEQGILYAAVVSSLFFALLHFDLTALPVYLFAGFLLALVLYITRSTLAAMVVHLGYNLFGVLAQAGLSGYCRSTGSVGLLVVILIALLLLSSAFFCGEVARILRRRAESSLLDSPEQIATPGLSRLSGRAFLPALGKAFLCPEAMLAVLLWAVSVVVNLVRK